MSNNNNSNENNNRKIPEKWQSRQSEAARGKPIAGKKTMKKFRYNLQEEIKKKKKTRNKRNK